MVASYATVKPLSLIGAAGFIELIGGALLIIGLCDAARGLRPLRHDGVRLFHRAHVHGDAGFHPLLNGGTLAALYCFTCLYLSTAGAGPWSADASMKKA